MHRSYVRAYEHRSMAVALPFVMHRLVPGEGGILGENCAISFIMWRNALDKLDYVEHDAPTSHVNVTSLETVERLGRKLQVDMNALKNFLSDVPDDEFEGKKRHQFHATITHVYSHPQTTKSSPPPPRPYIQKFLLLFCSGTIKFHKINHWAESIREFGHPSAYNAETWESAHKWFVKRWMGRMQYNRTGSIKMVMRRNNVAEIHRGSTVLQSGKRARRDYDVFKRVDGSPGFFHQFYFGQSGFWIHCRDSVLFGDDTNVNGLRPGRLESIHKTTDNVIILTIWLYTKAPTQSTTQHPLDDVCSRYALIAGPNKLVKIRPVEDDISVWPLAIQPDMDDRLNFFYECPWIDIVL